jgi:hypothetical protein
MTSKIGDYFINFYPEIKNNYNEPKLAINDFKCKIIGKNNLKKFYELKSDLPDYL